MRPTFCFAVVTTLMLGVNSPSVAQVRDSSGVRINDHRTAAPRTAFLVDSIPVLRFRGGPDSTRSIVHPTAMLRMRDGRVVVAESYSNFPAPPAGSPIEAYRIPVGAPPPTIELRFFDSTGQYIGKAGRAVRAPGPDAGQFSMGVQYLSELPNGAILAGQARDRWAELQGDGRVLWAPEVRGHEFNGAFTDGTFIVSTANATGRVTDYRNGPYTAAVMRYERISLDRDRSTVLPATTTRLLQILEPASVPTPMPPAGFPIQAPQAAVGGMTFWTFDATRWEARAHEADGTLTAIARPPVPATAVGATFGDPVPYAQVQGTRMVVDDAGRLWMSALVRPTGVPRYREHPRTWSVIDTTGELLGSVVLPEDFHPHQIGISYITGAIRHSDGSFSAAVFRYRPSR